MKPPLQKRQDWIRGRRQKRKLARQARLRRQILRYTLLAALVFAGVAGFAYVPWSLRCPAKISIHGNQVASNEQILAMLQPAIGKPLYKVDPHVLEHNVCELPVVKYAFVRRCILPSPALHVEVIEEFPWATLTGAPDGEPIAVISQTGRLIPVAQFPKVVQPQLRICASTDLKLNSQQIAEWDHWVRLVSGQLGHPVDFVDLRRPTAIEIGCGEIDLHVGQADSGLTRRLSRLSSVLPVVSTLHDKLAFIDLSLDWNIPLKVEKSATSAAREDELLRQAVHSIGTTPQQPPL